MPAYFCKLHPPRPTFARDMTPDEGAIMQQHAAHWQDGLARGKVVTFGFVADPAGGYGIGVVDVADEAEVRRFTDGDPAIRAARGFRFEVHPMPLGAARA